MNIVLRTKGYNPAIEETEIRMEEFKTILQFMKNSNLPFVAFIGNTPTAHPQYFDFLETCLKEEVYVRTALGNNDINDGDIIERLAQLASNTNSSGKDDKVGFMLDMTRFSSKNTDLMFAIEKLGRWSVGNAVFGPHDVDLLGICEKMVEIPMIPILKVGMSLPAPNNPYEVLPLDGYSEQIKKIVEVTEYRRNNEIGFIFDCGMPICKFEKSEIGELFTSPMTGFEFVCTTKVEILPGLKIAHCAVLAGETTVSLSDFNEFSEVTNYLNIYFKNYKSAFDACDTCTFKNKLCGGGCKGYHLNNK
jgi:radical SAM protein with 4Fe4S-binding SPASM domain